MRKIYILPALMVLAVVFSGCYQFTAPPAAVDGDTFTKRKISKRYTLPPQIRVLSVRRAQRIAVLNNPDYMSAAQAVNQAKAEYQRSFHSYFPKVTAGFDMDNTVNRYHGTKNTSVQGNRNFTTSTGLYTSLLVFDGLSRTMNMLSKKYSYKEQQALQDDARRLLLQAVSYAYNDILLAIEQNRIAKEDMNFQLETLRETQFKFEAGAVPLSDVLNFKILVNRAMNNQIEAQYQYNIARYALAQLMGLPKGSLEDSVEYSPISTIIDSALASADVYLDTALNNRPDLIGYRQQLKASQYQLYSTWGAFSPTVNVYTNLSMNTSQTRYGSSSTRPNSYYNNPRLGYGMQVDWVLFEGGKRWFDVRIAQTQLAQAKYAVASKWQQVVNDVRNAHDNYQQSAQKAKLFKETLALVVKQRDLVKEEYDAGNTELTRLNEAQRDKVEAETDFIKALVNIRNAKAQLDAATNSNDVGSFLNISEFRDNSSQANSTKAAPAAPKTAVVAASAKPAAKAARKKTAKTP